VTNQITAPNGCVKFGTIDNINGGTDQAAYLSYNCSYENRLAVPAVFAWTARTSLAGEVLGGQGPCNESQQSLMHILVV
jgi:hypothetical protein